MKLFSWRVNGGAAGSDRLAKLRVATVKRRIHHFCPEYTTKGRET